MTEKGGDCNQLRKKTSNLPCCILFFFLYKRNILYFSFCCPWPLFMALDFYEKSLALLFYLYNAYVITMKFLKVFLFPNCHKIIN